MKKVDKVTKEIVKKFSQTYEIRKDGHKVTFDINGNACAEICIEKIIEELEEIAHFFQKKGLLTVYMELKDRAHQWKHEKHNIYEL